MRRRYRSPLRLKGAAKLQVQDNPAHGIHVTGNACGFIGLRTAHGTVASPNVIRNNGLHGINVVFSSSVRIAGNTISDNVRNGINVAQASQATISDNTIDANGENGIFVTENSGVNLGSETGTAVSSTTPMERQ